MTKLLKINKMKKPLVIAIDGPSASGKGTLAKMLSKHFDLSYLNTGGIYRLVAFRVIEKEIDPNDFESFIPELVKDISENDLEREELHTEAVGSIASIIAKSPRLRAAVFSFQRDFVERGKEEKGGCVLDGRDTTTVICPDADYKFYIRADVEIRAKRRFEQLKTDYDEILSQLKQRDENDLNRQDSPLKIAGDAFVIDNGNLSIQEGFDKALSYID